MNLANGFALLIIDMNVGELYNRSAFTKKDRGALLDSVKTAKDRMSQKGVHIINTTSFLHPAFTPILGKFSSVRDVVDMRFGIDLSNQNEWSAFVPVPDDNEIVLIKNTYSADNLALQTFLSGHGIRTVFVCGVQEGHVSENSGSCVTATALDLVAKNYRTIILREGTNAREWFFQEQRTKNNNAAGIHVCSIDDARRIISGGRVPALS